MALLPTKPDNISVERQGDTAVKVTVKLEKKETSFVLSGIMSDEVSTYEDRVLVRTVEGDPLHLKLSALVPFSF